jgi:uncharacterized cupredoxin-like copper-binding protein
MGGGMMGDSGRSGDMAGMMGGGGPPGSITVQLRNWSITAEQTSTKAGQVTFHAVHSMMDMHGHDEGGYVHELAVARKNADGTYDLLGKAGDILMGQSKDLTLDLAPGNYELQCNVTEEVNGKVVSHYIEGMHAPFTVTS